LATSEVLVVDDADVVIRLGGAVDYSALAPLRSQVAAPGARVVLMVPSASLDRFRAADPRFHERGRGGITAHPWPYQPDLGWPRMPGRHA
jgi:hypothetical protein